MANDLNPYATPVLVPSVTPSIVDDEVRALRRRAYVMWPIVLALNLVVPGLLGLLTTDGLARIGMVAGVVVFLVGGWCLCRAQPRLATRLIGGAGYLVPTQFFPILQLFAGMLAIWVMEILGLGNNLHGSFDHFLGGFVATIVTGAGLLGIVLCGCLWADWAASH